MLRDDTRGYLRWSPHEWSACREVMIGNMQFSVRIPEDVRAVHNDIDVNLRASEIQKGKDEN